MTATELIERAERERQERIRTGWGNWRWHEGVLVYTGPYPGGFEIDGKEMDPGSLLGWLGHALGKGHFTREDRGDLLLALDDLFGLNGVLRASERIWRGR